MSRPFFNKVFGIYLLTRLFFCVILITCELKFIEYYSLFTMLIKVINNKHIILLIIFTFCLSCTTGGSLLYGSEVHFDHHNAHIHHTDKDHGLGGSDHKDADTILYLDYVIVNSSNPVKTLSSLNPCLLSCHSSTYCYNLSNSFSGILHYSNKCSFCTHDLYQLNSSYLI
jgi:hypothetical protein